MSTHTEYPDLKHGELHVKETNYSDYKAELSVFLEIRLYLLLQLHSVQSTAQIVSGQWTTAVSKLSTYAVLADL